MLTARQFVEASLGRDVFRHALGIENEHGTSIRQLFMELPDPAKIAAGLRFGGVDMDYSRLGIALAESCFKRLRADNLARVTNADGCASGVFDAAIYVAMFRSEEMHAAFMLHLSMLSCLSLTRPHLLPELYRRLDALDNAALEEQRYRAFCGERDEVTGELFGDDDGIFKGLC